MHTPRPYTRGRLASRASSTQSPASESSEAESRLSCGSGHVPLMLRSVVPLYVVDTERRFASGGGSPRGAEAARFAGDGIGSSGECECESEC